MAFLENDLGVMSGRFVLLNPDFAVEIVLRISNTMQISDSGYFLADKIVNYFEVKKCS